MRLHFGKQLKLKHQTDYMIDNEIINWNFFLCSNWSSHFLKKYSQMPFLAYNYIVKLLFINF